jgi:hypothetical protein
MSHCTQEEWDKTIQDWRKAKNDVFRIPAPEEEPKESMIPVGWIMEKMAEEEQKWEASCRSVSFHSDRVWALKYVLDEWVDYLADREMKKLGMGSN